MACPFLQNVQPDTAPSGCPFAGRAPESASETPNATCPLGFGSTGAALPSPLHCTQCRGLFHDCVRIEACGHKFCRFCIAPCQSFGCPLCGVDVDTLKADHETNGLVEKFLEIHAGNPDLWTKMAGVPPSQDTSKAGFLLLLGMQSYAGGNLAAALSRLQACKRELMLEAACTGKASADSSVAAASIKAGAVCGTMADCYKQMAQRTPAPRPPATPQQPPPAPPQQQERPSGGPEAADKQEPSTNASAAPPHGCPFHHAASAPGGAEAAATSQARSSSTEGQGATTTTSTATPSSTAAQPAADTAQQGAAAAAGCPHMQQQQPEVCAGFSQSRSGGVEIPEEEAPGQVEESAEQLLDHAAELYREGIELLASHVGMDPEAVHALAVTHNKLGDLQYVRGDVQGARQCYVRGLAVRQAALDAAGGPAGVPEGEALALDVAVSSIKVADASKALGDSTAVGKFCSKARQLLQSVQAGQAAAGGGSGAVAAKCQQLLQLLDSGLAAA